MTDLQVHPVADLFPMLAEDELAELAADIKEHGLFQPIVLDTEGRVLDGRNRLAACKLAGVEPTFETFSGEDPDGYALSVNIARRHLTKGQRALVVSDAFADKSFISTRRSAKIADVSQPMMVWANAVRRYPDLHDAVLAGTQQLNDAYKIVVARDEANAAREATERRLREQAPDLMALVDEGRISLDDAVSMLDSREEKARQEAELARQEAEAQAGEEARQRAAEQAQLRHEQQTATHQLCDVVVTLAQMAGFDIGYKYTPSDALPGRAVTRETLMNASRAVGELIDIWEERNLP